VFLSFLSGLQPYLVRTAFDVSFSPTTGRLKCRLSVFGLHLRPSVPLLSMIVVLVAVCNYFKKTPVLFFARSYPPLDFIARFTLMWRRRCPTRKGPLVPCLSVAINDLFHRLVFGTLSEGVIVTTPSESVSSLHGFRAVRSFSLRLFRHLLIYPHPRVILEAASFFRWTSPVR